MLGICYSIYYLCEFIQYIIDYTCTVVRYIQDYFYPPKICTFPKCKSRLGSVMDTDLYCFSHTCHLILCSNPVMTDQEDLTGCYCSKHQFTNQDYIEDS